MDNDVVIYKGNSATVTVEMSGLGSYSGYAPYFTMRKTINDTEKIMEKEGTISNDTATFNFVPEDTDIDPRQYVFDVTIEFGTNVYTIEIEDGRILGVLEIVDNVRY